MPRLLPPDPLEGDGDPNGKAAGSTRDYERLHRHRGYRQAQSIILSPEENAAIEKRVGEVRGYPEDFHERFLEICLSIAEFKKELKILRENKRRFSRNVFLNACAWFFYVMGCIILSPILMARHVSRFLLSILK